MTDYYPEKEVNDNHTLNHIDYHLENLQKSMSMIWNMVAIKSGIPYIVLHNMMVSNYYANVRFISFFQGYQNLLLLSSYVYL